MKEYQWRIQDFPEVGRQPSMGAPTYDFAKISQKLHEIERIWTPSRPLRSAAEYSKIVICVLNFIYFASEQKGVAQSVCGLKHNKS